MKIIEVQPYVVSQKLKQPFSFSQWEYDTRSICLVRVLAEDGTYGWGEGYGPSGVVKAGVDFLAPHVIGMHALHTDVVWEMMHQRTLDYARRGTLMAAVSAIDVALWDLKGKLLAQPVSVLLGGPKRNAVQVYATGMYFTQGDDLADRLAAEARDYANQGFAAIKMKVGMDIEADIENVTAVRNAIGPNVKLMVDANHAYSRYEARRLAVQLEDLDIGWFEEPLSPEDYDGYTELRQQTDIPIAAGECEYLCEGFRELLGRHCVDIAQPDICAAGGLSEVQRIAALARTFGVELTPHCWGTGIAFAAALHFAATISPMPGRMRASEPLLEMDRTENPLRDELVVPRGTPVDGAVEVPTVPGLGIDVDEDKLKKYTKALR